MLYGGSSESLLNPDHCCVDSLCCDDDDEIEDELMSIEDDILFVLMMKRKGYHILDEANMTCSGRRHYNKKIIYFTDPNTGVRTVMIWKHTLWFQQYVLSPKPECQRWHSKFRRRFRMPYESYLKLVQDCLDSPIFKLWTCYKKRYNQKKGAPIELLVLCVLRYLGRGWTIDDLNETTIINYETIWKFIHQFLLFGSTTLYEKYVISPANEQQLKDCEHLLNLLVSRDVLVLLMQPIL